LESVSKKLKQRDYQLLKEEIKFKEIWKETKLLNP
jgi:uncharacterized protein YukJ